MRRGDVIGKKFGRLTVLSTEDVKERGKNRNYLRVFGVCRCDCGATHRARLDGITNGKVQSCGCLQAETGAKNGRAQRVHGLSGTRHMSRWANMVRRCADPNDAHFHCYGGRGIRVCERWLDFSNYISDTGLPPFPGAELDRIDNDGNYEPGNVRWVTRTQNRNNQRDNIMVNFNGKTMTIAEWAREIGLKYDTLVTRYRRGWNVSRMMSAKLEKQSRTTKPLLPVEISDPAF